jgi:electron transfer flavoprotein beta subunit
MVNIIVLLRAARRDPDSDDVLPGLGPNDLAALRLALSLSTARVTALTMGTDADEQALHQALALGAHKALRIEDADEGLRTADQIAPVLAAVFETLPYDLLLTGQRSADWGSGILGASLAQRLDIPYLSQVSQLVVANGNLVASQTHGDLEVRVTLPLPSLLSVASAPPSNTVIPSAAPQGQHAIEIVDTDDLEFTDASFRGNALPRLLPVKEGTCELVNTPDELLERLRELKFEV